MTQSNRSHASSKMTQSNLTSCHYDRDSIQPSFVPHCEGLAGLSQKKNVEYSMDVFVDVRLENMSDATLTLQGHKSILINVSIFP